MSVYNWDFRNKHVDHQYNDDHGSNHFISSETTLIAAGPAELSQDPNVTGDDGGIGITTEVTPLAILDSAVVRQQNALQRVFEIGSKRNYFIPGRTVGSLSLDKVMYNKKSLLRLMYDRVEDEDIDVAPGDERAYKLWVGLANQVFEYPVGLAFYFVDQSMSPYGAFYCEYCYIDNHQLGIRAGSVVISESATVQFDKIKHLSFFSLDTD